MYVVGVAVPGGRDQIFAHLRLARGIRFGFII